ncbi:transglycosylase SLT domain-containing protein [Methylorubrum rhodesianum]|jgi:soluble lytic murein transglycosylase-like protein|uniref:transglycosylase SLT domain-containing protein n=1 Tax=Methylorubrum TaxID=2282523 RepID=UPI00034C4556|nr:MULTISPECIES: transglycosylase SLT domain-containing protein [Methylorubrum]MBB5765444.1 soluble lytic murein transglycosylase-like protein [Methylorubrum rhodesianum]MBI1691641.1 lytic transglycosylase domain-containing protein [Methylorubrum sp. DB1722]MRI56611.1 lytic transglycosylase domain-containing protein [Methylobacterium sp. DB1607]
MKRILAGAITAACISSVVGPAAAAAPGDASRVCERQMAQAAAKHGVPLGMLYAVGLTESGNRGSLQPYAMNIQGKAYFGSSAADVVQRLAQAQREGVRLVDLGCMQINHHYHRAKFASLEAMIDPAQNVEYATRFLKELKEREGSWTLAVARYHAGPNNNPAQKVYVCRVITNMVASGFGNWTPGAKAFCQ